MASLSELTALKTKVEELKQRADKAAGALEQSMAMLNEDFGCDSLEAAKKKLKKMERECAEAEESFEKELAEFKEKMEAVLND